MNYSRWSIVLFSAMLAAPVAAAERPVGFAVASGTFLVDAYETVGSGTIFDGSSVETSAVPAVLKLNSGMQFRLAAHSRVRIQGASLIIEKGLGQVSNPGKYEIHARTLRISAAAPNSVGRIGLLEDDDTVSVSTIGGAFRVSNPAGAVVADVGAGTARNLIPQRVSIAANALTRVVGCVEQRDEEFFLKDEISKTIVQLMAVELIDQQTGESTVFDLTEEVRKRVDLTGQSQSSLSAKAAAAFTPSTLKRIGSCRPLAAIWFPTLAGLASAGVACGLNCPQPAPISR